MLAVDKPAGIDVHPTRLDPGEATLVDLIRAQLGLDPYPVHRLDRPTAGLIVFALDAEAARSLGAAFATHRVEKVYQALVRGWLPSTRATFEVQPDVKDPRRLSAETLFTARDFYDLPWPRRGFPSFRLSLVEARPVTGRRHQIRQHCDDLRHPILGDTVWGDTALNRWWRERLAGEGLEAGGLQLWSRRLTLPHPDTGLPLTLEAPVADGLARCLEVLGRHRAAGPVPLPNAT